MLASKNQFGDFPFNSTKFNPNNSIVKEIVELALKNASRFYGPTDESKPLSWNISELLMDDY